MTTRGTPPLADELAQEVAASLKPRGVSVAKSGCTHSVAVAYSLTDSGRIMDQLYSVGFNLTLKLANASGAPVGQGTSSGNIPCVDTTLTNGSCRLAAVRQVEGALADLLASTKVLGAPRAQPGGLKPLKLVLSPAADTNPKLAERLAAHLKEAMVPLGFDVVETAAAPPVVNLKLAVVDRGSMMIAQIRNYEVSIQGTLTDQDGVTPLTGVTKMIPCINPSLTPVSCWQALARPLGEMAEQISTRLGGKRALKTTQHTVAPARLGTLSWAAQAGDLALLKEQLVADPTALKKESLPTPLEIAGMVRALRANGAQADGADDGTDAELRPVDVAIRRGLPTVVETLMADGARVNRLRFGKMAGCDAQAPAVRAVLARHGFNFKACDER